jgi:hypothetical protein
MNLNTIKAQLKPKALDGGLSVFYANLKEKYPKGNNLTYIKDTPCVLGCSSIIRKLIKILSLQPGTLSQKKPQVFAPTPINKVILEPIVNKENLDWNVQKIKNTKKDLNANHAVSLYNINRKLSYLVAYDLNLNEKALEKYLQYINDELEYLENIINLLGREKSNVVLNLDEIPSKLIIDTNVKRRNQVKNVFNLPLPDEENNEQDLPFDE